MRLFVSTSTVATMVSEPPSSTLRAPDGGVEVEKAADDIRRVSLQVEHLVGEDRREAVEAGAALGGLRVHAVDRLDAQQSVELLVLLGRAHLTRDHVAGAQAEAT